MRAQSALVVGGVVAGQEHLCGKSSAVQSDRDAVPGKGGDDCRLIADTPQAARLCGEIPVRDGRDGQWPRPQGSAACKKPAEVAIFAQNLPEKLRPSAKTAKRGTPHDEAKIGDVVLNQRHASVAAGEEVEIHALTESVNLRGRQLPMQFEADEIGLFGGTADKAAQVMLAGGEKDVEVRAGRRHC